MYDPCPNDFCIVWKVTSLFGYSMLFNITADDADDPSEILQNANVGVLDNPTCQDRLAPSENGWIMDFHICSDNSYAQTCRVSLLKCRHRVQRSVWSLLGIIAKQA